MGKSRLEAALLHQIRAAKLPEPKREYRFHSKRLWRADFAYPKLKILIEVQGGVWVNGGHSRGSGQNKDFEKFNAAQLEGWSVYQFTTNHIRTGMALEVIDSAIQRATH
ncbi:endonuclease domain-containing protein [Endozoicomonas sp. Mp262]|uniref:endonuclease domain-containing protein n=1 Tax=Endozoicomonas sp. Mp262 TaxID=2919499 RepID=UPI0021D88D3B